MAYTNDESTVVWNGLPRVPGIFVDAIVQND